MLTPHDSQASTYMEKRADEENIQSQWQEKLSLAQKFAAATLENFGFQVQFVRDTSAGLLAVLMNDEKTATIDEQGSISTQPNIAIRN